MSIKIEYLLLPLLFLLGCVPENTPTTLTGSAIDAMATVTSSSSDIKRVVTTGESLSFNNQTGGSLDMRLHPTTKLPAIAYYDKSHVGNGTGGTPAIGALKYAYTDSTGAWNIEVVDVNYGIVACGAAGSFCVGAPNVAGGNVSGIISLGFKSDGTPAIAYVYGASLTGPGTKDIRYATRSSAGVWTIETAFSSTIGAGAGEVSTNAAVEPLKAVTLLFDGSDRPHVTFALYASTIASSQIKYAFRDSSGNWTNNNITPAVQGGTITVAGQGALQAGSAWCSNTAGPVYAYQIVSAAAGFGHPAYIRCTTVGASGICSAWSVLDLVNDCTASTASCVSSFTYAADGAAAGTNAGNRVDLAIEPTTNKPVLAIFSTATPATAIHTIIAPNACDVAQTSTTNAWGATTVVESAATTGQNGLRLIASSSASMYLSYLASTTSVRANRTTSGLGGWFATGHTVETNTVAGEGIAMAYDATSDTLYTAYARLPGAAGGSVGNDIVLTYTDPDNLSNASTAEVFSMELIDNTGNTFPSPTASTQPFFTAAKAPSGLIGYSYFFQDATAADMKLYYGLRAGSASAPFFSERMVTAHQESTGAGTGVGLAPSLAFDANSNPIIAAYNGVAADQSLYVARSNNGGVNFSVTTVDALAANVGLYPSAATYGNYIGVAYRDETNTGLKFARWSPVGGWRVFTVDGLAGTGVCDATRTSGQFTKLVYTSTGVPVIAFQDDSAASVSVRLAVAGQSVSSSSFTWTCLTVDVNAANTRGEGIDLALDSSNRPHIIHYDFTAGTIRYVNSSQAVATAVATGTSAFSAGDISTVGVTTIQNANNRPGIQINSSGTIYATFQNINSDSLILATKTSLTADYSNFTLETIDVAPTGSSSTTPILGQMTSLLLNDSSKPLIFYRGYENWIRYFSRE